MISDSLAVRFLESVTPHLNNQAVLSSLVRNRWPADYLCQLLEVSSMDLVRAAATCLGHNGQMKHVRSLADLLVYSDAQTAELAERSLWQIWMTAGTTVGNSRLAKAVRCIRDDDPDAAIQILEDLILDEPTFAEAHHQLGIALCLVDRFDEAETEFKRTLELNPHHFSAMSGLANVAAYRGDVKSAIKYYERTLAMNPRAEGARAALSEIESMMKRKAS